MNHSHFNQPKAGSSRREFLKDSSKFAAASALAGVALPRVHAATENTIRVALIGCGGRGTGAAANAMSVTTAPTKLVAMADVFEHRLHGSYEGLQRRHSDRMDVPEDRRFIGFDAYKKAIDTLRPGDIAIFATPPAFRWVHFTYAIEKGVHVFMEKPVTVDAPTTQRMYRLAKEADKKNLKVGVGLMVRHCRARQELLQRIRDGQIGDLITLRAYRMHGPVGSAFSGPPPKDGSELLYQIQRFHSFLWASGGLFSDFYIHQVDECCWMKGKWPVQAHATGGRHYREDKVDQNFDNYSVEYTYDDGTKFFLYGRTMGGCFDNFSSIAHGSKGLGIISMAGHSPGRCRTFKDHSMEQLIWAYPDGEKNPYQLEWEDLVEAIIKDKPFNEVERGATASLVTSMGRMAAHTGQVVTFDEMLKHDHEFAPDVDKLTMNSPAPVQSGPDGKYPVPMPGIIKNQEYLSVGQG